MNMRIQAVAVGLLVSLAMGRAQVMPTAVTAAQRQALRDLPPAAVAWDGAGIPTSIRGAELAPVEAADRRTVAETTPLTPEAHARATVERWNALYRMPSASNAWTALRTERDERGDRHVRLAQRHRGLRVEGGELIVHLDAADRAYQINGRYVPDVQLNPIPALTAEETERLAQADLAAMGKRETYRLRAPPELAIYAVDRDPLLAYHLELANAAESDAWRYWIDARTGALVTRFCNVRRAAAAMTGYALTGEGGGAVTVTGTLSGTSYQLTNAAWYVFNSDTLRRFPDSGKVYARTYANWTTDRTDRVGMSAGYNIDATLRYWRTLHNRASYDNANAVVRVNVLDNSDVDNAYWYNNQITFFLVSTNYGDLMVLDVMAHEFGHAIDERLANFTYQNESGALDESFADIWGAATEFFAQTDGRSSYPDSLAGKADWFMAEDCMVGAEPAFRDMRAPRNAAISSRQPSRYGGTYWQNYRTDTSDNGGVHVNSGVQNFMFYLLVEGGSGDNDGLAYTVTGLGVTNAAKIAYRALNYLTANATYSNAYTAWMSAAADLNAAWTTSVNNAWAAVGLATAVAASTPPQTLSVTVNLSQAVWRLTQYPAAYSNATVGTGSLATVTAPEGVYAIVFDALTGYRTPDPQTNTVTASAGVAFNGVYASVQGTLAIAVTPDSGGWRLTAYPTQYSGALSGVGSLAAVVAATGVYAVTFEALDRYRTPSDRTGLLDEGGALVLTGAYARIQAGGDFDGDGLADLTLYQRVTADWYVLLSSGGYRLPRDAAARFGASGYTPFASDFDGDGYADLAVSGPAGDWYYRLSGAGYAVSGPATYGGVGYTQTAADFDGDGRADQTLYSAALGYWYTLGTVSGQWTSQWFGANGYTPVPGDFDGDGYADPAVYHSASGYWFVLPSSTQAYYGQWFGGAGLIPVTADFDGDGRADYMVYDEGVGVWYVLPSAGGGAYYYAIGFGAAGYAPVGG